MNNAAFASIMQTRVEALESEKAMLQREVDELRAQNMLMYNSIEFDTIAWEDEREGGVGDRELINKTPKQCLAQVQHDAIIEAVKHADIIVDEMDGERWCHEANLTEYADNILTQAKENK